MLLQMAYAQCAFNAFVLLSVPSLKYLPGTHYADMVPSDSISSGSWRAGHSLIIQLNYDNLKLRNYYAKDCTT